MPKASYLTYLKRRIMELETRIKADRERLAGGSSYQKVEAAGDMALAEKRLASAKEKLTRLETEPEGAWESFKSEFEEDFDIIESAFDRSVEGGR